MTSSPTRALRAALLSMCVVVTIAGCGSSAEPASTEASVSATVAVADGVPDVLDFSAPLVGGGEFRGADVAGRPVAFWFWAPT